MSLLLRIGIAWIVKEACVANGMSVLGWSVFAAPFVFALVRGWARKRIVAVSLGVVGLLEAQLGHVSASVVAIGVVILLFALKQPEKQSAPQSSVQTHEQRPTSEPEHDVALEDVYYIPPPAKQRVLN
jgi:hypothetical protein